MAKKTFLAAQQSYRHVTGLCFKFFLSLVVGTMSGLGVQYPRRRDSIPSRDKRFFLFSTAPGRLWSPQNLLFNGYRVLFLRRGEFSTLIIHLQPVLRLRIRGAIPSMPIHLKSVRRDSFAVTFLS